MRDRIPSRALALHPGALGDVLLSIPALRALRAEACGRELVLAAQPRIGRILETLGVVDRHLAFDTLGVETLFTDGEPSARIGALVKGARVVSWFGHADPDFARRLRALAPAAIVASTAAPADTTVWEYLLASVTPSRPAHAWREPATVPRAIVAEGRRVLAAAGWDGVRPLVALHPGAGGAPKRWPVEGFAAAAAALRDALGADLLVHDGPADHDAVAALRTHLRAPVIQLTEPSLETLVGVMRHATLWLGNDSGVTHLATTIGTPTLALFIATHVGWRPWSPRARVRVVAVDAIAGGDLEGVIADASQLAGSATVGAGDSR